MNCRLFWKQDKKINSRVGRIGKEDENQLLPNNDYIGKIRLLFFLSILFFLSCIQMKPSQNKRAKDNISHTGSQLPTWLFSLLFLEPSQKHEKEIFSHVNPMSLLCVGISMFICYLHLSREFSCECHLFSPFHSWLFHPSNTSINN